MPWARPLIVTEVPVPVEVTLPGLRVSVHVPGDGNPLRITDPVAIAQVGGVIMPTVGASGAVTVSVAIADVMLPHAPVTIAWYW